MSFTASPCSGVAVGVGTTAVGVAVGAVLGLFVFGAVVIAGAFVTAGFFSLTVTLQVSFFFPTFANTTAFPAFFPFTTTLVFFFFERLTTFLPDLMDQTAFFPFFSLIVFFCPTEMLTFFVLSFGAFFFAAAGALTAAALYLHHREKELDEYERLLFSDDYDDFDDEDDTNAEDTTTYEKIPDAPNTEE